jgi:demethylmenaquinone methyltransferase/2-methoxy-6-polyprenyl-1,4-benzoquinol methylase
MANPERLNMKEFITSKEKKQLYVNQMFSKIAPRYDVVTMLLSYWQDRRWKKKLVRLTEVQPHHFILDLACGTGDITFMLAKMVTTGRVIGVDITPGMIEIARRKKQQLGITGIDFEVNDITRLDFPANSFDRITVGYGVRNVPDIAQLFSEVFRMLKPGGRFLSLDFAKPVNPLWCQVYLGYLTIVGSTMGWVMHGDPDVYRYIPESLKLYPAQHGVQQLMDKAGFVDTGHLTFGGGITAINYGRKSSVP